MDEHWRGGYAAWQEFYGTHLAEEIRADLHARRYSAAARKAGLVARLAPDVFQRELVRALRRRSNGHGASASRRVAS